MERDTGHQGYTGPNTYQLDPLLPSYAPNSHLDPKNTAYAGARSFADSESHRSVSGDRKPSSTPHQHGTRNHVKRWGYSLRNWSWELATWVLGTAAFVVIVVLLITFEGKRFDEWHSDIQITTVIAALSQLAQSALLVSLAACLGQLKWTWLRDERSAQDLQLFDEASRGPYGSLRLLGFGLLPSSAARPRRFGFPKLAVLGALAVILMLAFSTFAQQSVAIVLRQYTVDDLAPSLNRTERYAQIDGTTLLAQGLSTTDGDPFMSDAIFSGGLQRQNLLSDVTGNCTSERCDWEPYWTLAVCPTVEDVTSRITSIDPGRVEGIPITAHTLERGKYLSLSLASDDFYFQDLNRTLYPTSNMTIERRGTISDTLLTWYDPCNPDYTDNHNNTQYWRAHRATLSMCFQRLNSSFHNSTMHTEVLESKTDIVWRTEPLPQSGSPDVCGDSPDGTHCVREDYIKAWAFNLYSDGALNGSASAVPGGDNYYYPNGVRKFVIDVLGLDPTICQNDESLGFAGFEKRIQNIATSMSNTMRLAPNGTRMFGKATASAQFIDVSAQWLAYPAALWLMSTIFLIGTISHSRASGAPLWKSSSLALLTSRDPNNDLRSEYEVTQAFKHTGMQLRDNGYGWQLVQHGGGTVR